jgi:TorA maturation chaperone TorD
VEVDQPLLESLKKTNFVIDGSLSADVPDIEEGYRLWTDFLRHTRETVLTDLSVDYVRTFIGSGRSVKTAAYPYESVYTSEHGMLMQDARDEVIYLYQTEGLHKVDNFNEPEDHLGIELEFMALLCEKAQDTLKAGDVRKTLDHLRKQEEFLSQHLLNWVPRFCEDVLKFAREDLYRGLAKITLGLLRLDQETIQDLLAELMAVVEEE